MASGAASATRVSHLPESLPLPLVRFLLAQPRSLSGNLRLLAVDRGVCPRTIFALGRSDGRTVILCLVNGEAGDDQLREARRRVDAAVAGKDEAAAAARPRVIALAGRFSAAWQQPIDSAETEVPELWLWSQALPTDPDPVRLSRFTPDTGRAETGGEPEESTPDLAPERIDGEDGSGSVSSDLGSPDPWALPSGATRLSPDEVASLLDTPPGGDALGNAGT